MAKNWITVQPSLDPILAPVNAVIESIDSVLSFLIALLNVVQTILNIVKVFLVGLLNPIRAIVEAIIAEIRKIISDLRQAGLYIADDYELFSAQPVDTTENLRGGYSAYERRMLTRLLDASDPTRPDFSSATTVVALFAYISSGDVFALSELLKRLVAFFGKRTNNPAAPFAAPTTPTAQLGTFGLPAVRYKRPSELTEGSPDAVRISWTMPSTGTPFANPPRGFLVHVSTVPDGFGVRAIKPNRENSTDTENLPAALLAGIDPTDGAELRLYGGLCDISFSGSPAIFSNNVENEQANKIYFSLDQNTPLISPSELDKGSTPLGAATFSFVQPAAGLLPAGSSYSCVIPKSLFPQRISVSASGGKSTVTGEDASTFYVRVRPVDKNYASQLTGTPKDVTVVSAASPWKPYVITDSNVTAAPGNILNPFVGSEATGLYGPASQAAEVSFPTADQLDFITATKTALALLILVRPDLVEEPLVEEDDESRRQPAPNTFTTGYATGLETLRTLLTKVGINPRFYKEADDSSTFASQVLIKVDLLTDILLSKYTPSQSILEATASFVEKLNEFTWSDLDSQWPEETVLGLLNSTNITSGISGKPSAIGGGSVEMSRPESLSASDPRWLNRAPIFPVKFGPSTTPGKFEDIRSISPFTEGEGWSDYCPVIYADTLLVFGDDLEDSFYEPQYAQYVRRLLLVDDQGELLTAAASVLNIASAPLLSLTSGQWTAIRFLDNVLQPLDGLLSDLDAFLQSILDGLQGTIDKIIQYIEGIQARINQLQALLLKIRALLNSLTLFDLPAFSGLLLVENGTDGVASALATSGNKPTDGPTAYAAGAVVVFGGLPAVFLELIALVLEGGGD